MQIISQRPTQDAPLLLDCMHSFISLFITVMFTPYRSTVPGTKAVWQTGGVEDGRERCALGERGAAARVSRQCVALMLIRCQRASDRRGESADYATEHYRQLGWKVDMIVCGFMCYLQLDSSNVHSRRVKEVESWRARAPPHPAWLPLLPLLVVTYEATDPADVAQSLCRTKHYYRRLVDGGEEEEEKSARATFPLSA